MKKGIGQVGLLSSEEAPVGILITKALSYVKLDEKQLSSSVSTSGFNSPRRRDDCLEVLIISSLH